MSAPDRVPDGSVIGVSETTDDLYLPAVDACSYAFCRRPRADHDDHDDLAHSFLPPARKPRPERVAAAHITTAWTCTACGADMDVWGVGDGWVDCTECGKSSFLI